MGLNPCKYALCVACSGLTPSWIFWDSNLSWRYAVHGVITW
jgi:hypothetical protein